MQSFQKDKCGHITKTLFGGRGAGLWRKRINESGYILITPQLQPTPQKNFHHNPKCFRITVNDENNYHLNPPNYFGYV